MKKSVSAVIVTLFIALSAFSAPRAAQDLIPVGHWSYQAFNAICVETGRMSMADQAPMTIGEFKTYLEDVDYDRLSPGGKKQYDLLLQYFQEKNWSVNAGIFQAGFEPQINLEGYVKTDNDIDWVYDYTQKQNLIDLPIRIALGDWLSLFANIDLGLNRFEMERNKFYSNLPLSLDSIDSFIVHNSYLSAGYVFKNNVGFNLRFGISPQVYGNSILPSTISSQYMTDNANVHLRIFSPYVNYECSITQFNKKAHLYLHSFEVRFLKKIGLQFYEGILPYDQFELKYLNPFGIFHGFGLFNEDDTKINSFFALKANIVPCDYLRLYFMMTCNEHQMLTEKAFKIPEGQGYQAGVETYFPVSSGIFHIALEGYYSTPYLYIKEMPQFSFARVYNALTGSGDYYQWMGSPYGPDSLVGKLVVDYEQPGLWKIEGAYTFAAMGENSGMSLFKNLGWTAWNQSDESIAGNWIYNRKTGEEMCSQVSPSGVVQFVNTVSVKATYKLFDYLEFTMQPSYVIISNYDHIAGQSKHGFELAAGVRFYPTKLFKLKESNIWYDRRDLKKQE